MDSIRNYCNVLCRAFKSDKMKTSVISLKTWMVSLGINCGVFCIQQLDLWCWGCGALELLCKTSLWLCLCPSHPQLGRKTIALSSSQPSICRSPYPWWLSVCAAQCVVCAVPLPRLPRRFTVQSSWHPPRKNNIFVLQVAIKLGVIWLASLEKFVSFGSRIAWKARAVSSKSNQSLCQPLTQQQLIMFDNKHTK